MANLTPATTFDDVLQLETTDVVVGGGGGKSNVQAQQLLNRTAYLKDLFDSFRFNVGKSAQFLNVTSSMTRALHAGNVTSVNTTGQGTKVITLPSAATLVKGDRFFIAGTTATEFNDYAVIQRAGSDNLYFHGDTVASFRLRRGDFCVIEVFQTAGFVVTVYYRHRVPGTLNASDGASIHGDDGGVSYMDETHIGKVVTLILDGGVAGSIFGLPNPAGHANEQIILRAETHDPTNTFEVRASSISGSFRTLSADTSLSGAGGISVGVVSDGVDWIQIF